MKRLWKATSTGFKLLLLTSVGVVAFFVWGFRTPRLETVWQLEQELKTGIIVNLKKNEKQLFYDVMADYPDYEEFLAGDRGIDILSANIDGRSLTDRIIVLRTKKASSCGRFSLDLSAHESVFPVVFHVQGRTWDRDLTVKGPGRVPVHLPRSVLLPEIIEVSRPDMAIKGEVEIKVRFCQ